MTCRPVNKTTYRLYLNSAKDFSIALHVFIGWQHTSREISLDEAKRIWATGNVTDINVAFQRLINHRWDLKATKASYSLGFHMMTPTVTS